MTQPPGHEIHFTKLTVEEAWGQLRGRYGLYHRRQHETILNVLLGFEPNKSTLKSRGLTTGPLII